MAPRFEQPHTFNYPRPPLGGYFLTPEFHTWPDVRAAGPEAIGGYITVSMWAIEQGYDGDLETYLLRLGKGTARIAARLVDTGLWSRHGKAYRHVTLAQLQTRRGYRGMTMPVTRLLPNSSPAHTGGFAGFGAWALAASWTLTTADPGFVTDEAVRMLRIGRYADRLCAPAPVGIPLWERVDGGYWMQDDDHPCEERWTITRNDERQPIPDKLRLRVYGRDEYRCVWCGSTDDLALDHIYPWSRGGPDTYDNLQTLCRPCNSRKGARVHMRQARHYPPGRRP